MRRIVFLVVAAMAWCTCSTAHSDIRLDFSNQVGTTGGNWNNISNLSGLTPNLIDFNTGAGTGVSIDGLGGPWNNFFGDNAGVFPNQDWLIQPATQDGAGLQADLTGAFRISGLGTGPYRIEIVSARTSFNYLNTFTVGGALANRTFLGTPVNTPWDATADGLTPGNWLIWDNVNAVGGSITVTNVAGPGTLGILNAMRIYQIPEPSSAILLFSGLAVCLVRRRRI